MSRKLKTLIWNKKLQKLRTRELLNSRLMPKKKSTKKKSGNLHEYSCVQAPKLKKKNTNHCINNKHRIKKILQVLKSRSNKKK